MLETMIDGLRPRGVTWFVAAAATRLAATASGEVVPAQRAVAVDPVGVPAG